MVWHTTKEFNERGDKEQPAPDEEPTTPAAGRIKDLEAQLRGEPVSNEFTLPTAGRISELEAALETAQTSLRHGNKAKQVRLARKRNLTP